MIPNSPCEDERRDTSGKEHESKEGLESLTRSSNSSWYFNSKATKHVNKQ
jgi:hypothetical protein